MTTNNSFFEDLLGDPELARPLFQSFVQEQQGGATGTRQRFFSQDSVFNNIRNEFQGLLVSQLRKNPKQKSFLSFQEFLGGRSDDPETQDIDETRNAFDFEGRFRSSPQNFLQRQSSQRLLAPRTQFRF